MIAFCIVGSVCLLLALGCAQGIFHWLRKAYVTSRWPAVRGTITSTWEMLNGERVKYDYAVNGTRYVGHQVSFGARGGSADPTCRELAEKYPPGREVTVYYDPSHPATAVLEPRNMRNAAMSAVFTVAFGVFGVVFLAVALAHGS